MGAVNKEKLIRVVEACGKILSLGLRGLDAIILFGSVARGEEDRRSDTDLLLLFEDEEKALQAEDETAKIAAENSDIRLSIVNKGYDEFSGNPYFSFEILRDGIVLYKKPSVLTLGAPILLTKPFYIYILNMKELDKGER